MQSAYKLEWLHTSRGNSNNKSKFSEKTQTQGHSLTVPHKAYTSFIKSTKLLQVTVESILSFFCFLFFAAEKLKQHNHDFVDFKKSSLKKKKEIS